MIKRTVLIFIIADMLLLGAEGYAQYSSSGFGDAVETVGQGTINWTSGDVIATGIGAPPASAVNPAQARAMAERAAMVVALRNLLEIVKGVRVDSETIVENFVTKNDIIRTRVEGIVRGAMPIKKQYLSDGSVEITVSMKLRGALMDAIIPESFGRKSNDVVPPSNLPTPIQRTPETKQVPLTPSAKPQPGASLPEPGKRSEPTKSEPSKPQPTPQLQIDKKPDVPKQEPPLSPVVPATPDHTTVQFKGGKATGIVIDGRGLGLKPALLPKIMDPQGQEIYVGQVVPRTNAVEQGVAGYAKDVNAAANNFRVTDNPAIIRGLRASGAARTDIVLSQTDAQMLRELSNKGDFLQYCRVIIVY